MSIKTLCDAKIYVENLKNFYLEKSDKEAVSLTNDLNMHHEDLMSDLHLKQTAKLSILILCLILIFHLKYFI